MSLKKRKLLFDTEYFPHYYLCTYIPKGAGSDKLSQSLVHFKNGMPPHRQAWIECAIEEIRNVEEVKNSYVVRALGHTERIHDPTSHPPINSLTLKISHAIYGTSVSQFLEKTRDICKLSRLNKIEREREIHAAYRFHLPMSLPSFKHILIIDDILTSGATMKGIISAILKEKPSINVSIFTLAHTDSSGSNEDVTLAGENYRWSPNEEWVVAEDQPGYANALERLKGFIRNDSFSNL